MEGEGQTVRHKEIKKKKKIPETERWGETKNKHRNKEKGIEMEQRERVEGHREKESGKPRLPKPQTSWSPEDVFPAGKRLTGRGLRWSHLLPGPPFSLQAKWLGFSLACRLLPPLSLLFFSARKPQPDAGPLPPPSPSTGDGHVLVAAALQVSRPPGAATVGPRGLETTNDSLLTGCWLPAACQPVPLHMADNHVRQGNPSCPWSCDLNLNFVLLSFPGEARFRL